MIKNATIYDICDQQILHEDCRTEPGQNLRKVYKKLVANPLLKYLVLRGCRHPDIGLAEIGPYQAMMGMAMQASYHDWQDAQWIETTFLPLVSLLDRLESPCWQVREKIDPVEYESDPEDIRLLIDHCLRDILRVWDKDLPDPWFPVAAQIVLSGDDHMDGESFLNVLRGIGNFEYKNITVLFALIRCFLMSTPSKLMLIRKPYNGVCEPMSGSLGWLWHRIAFSDVNFFEHLLVFLGSDNSHKKHYPQIVPILDNLLRYCVITSREWLVTPNNSVRHPAITCLPQDAEGRQLCYLTDSAWQIKRDLGFGDYVPDTDTTFLTLAMARKWLDWVEREQLTVDRELIEECELILAFPWVEIIGEYQVGGRYNSNPPTIHNTKPLDYDGAVPIWFDKQFEKAEGRIEREIFGNLICPGHNMDILDSILLNRKQWRALEDKNLLFLHKLLDFHHRAFVSGNFRIETSLQYYLPEIYTYYMGRFYQTCKTLNDLEKRTLDSDGKIEEMRRIALQYCRDELLGYTLNAFDASLAVSALALLEYEPRHDGLIAAGLKVMRDAVGEGGQGHPFKAYEWNRMRDPTRILVGSGVLTSLFVLRACSEAMRYLNGENSADTLP